MKTLSFLNFCKRVVFLAVLAGTLGSAVGVAHATTVTTSKDEDDGSINPSLGTGTSLREAINSALANGNPSINFNLPVGDRTIALLSALPTLTKTVLIDGAPGGPPTSGGVTITRSTADGTPDFAIFKVVGSAMSSSPITLRLTNLTVSNGKTTGNGGAISLQEASLSLQACTLVGNSAGYGGAIYSATSSDYSGNNFPATTTSLVNCTLTGNSAAHGGAVYVYQGKTTLNSCTIVGNQALQGQGAGIEATQFSHSEIGNSIIAGNLTNDATPNYNTDVVDPSTVVPAMVSTGYNLVGDGSSAPQFVAAGDRYNVSDFDLQISPLADNGGLTPTMAIVQTSPAFNSGNTALTVDQRGTARPLNGVDDIGAFEATGPTSTTPSLVVTTLEDEDNGTSDPSIGYGTSLREAIKTANSNSDFSAITFNLSTGNRYITLHSALPDLTSPLSITGRASGGAGIILQRFNTSNSALFRPITITNTVTLSNLTIQGGFGTGDGGGAILNNGGLATISNCAFIGNEAYAGGAIYSNTSTTNTSTSGTLLSNCTFSGNKANGAAGGAVANVSGRTVLDSCTLFGNYAPGTQGGAVSTTNYNGTRTEVGNCIIGGNLSTANAAAPNGDVVVVPATATTGFVSNGANILGDGNAVAQFTAAGDRVNVADSAFHLGVLADNGGPSSTMALLTGSPAINTGVTALTVDQRGVARPQARQKDVGAFEAVNPVFNSSLVVNISDDEDNGTSDPTIGKGTSLREAIDAANANADLSNITFNLPVGNRVIVLNSELPTMAYDMSIIGPTSGGGVTITRSSAPGTAAFRIFTVQNNTFTLSNLTISNGDVSNSGYGGAIMNYDGILTVTGCTLINNSANFGGAISNLTTAEDYNGSLVTIRNCTIANNHSTLSGGGIFNAAGKMVIDSCTVTGNQSGVGAAGLVSSTNAKARIEIGNSVIAGNLNANTPPTSALDVTAGGDQPSNFVSNGYNLIGDFGGNAQFSAPGDQINVADDAVKLAPLADNGGPTQTMALLPGSPAFNTGSTTLTVDQRGTARPQGTKADIGAFEQFVDSKAPVQVITTPYSNQTLSPAALTAISGNATDNVAVSEVTLKLFRTRNGVNSFWNGSSFGAAAVLFPATLANPGAASTTWSFPVSADLRAAMAADLGAYTVVAYAKDSSGNASGAIGSNFTLVSDTTIPTAIISTPRPTQNLPTPSFTAVSGTASDNIGVTQVFVKFFRNRSGVNTFWDGTSFGTAAVQLPATVTSPGSPNVPWTFPVTDALRAALDDGAYTATVYAKDAAGNTSNPVGCNFLLHSDVTLPTVAITTPTQNQSLDVSSFSSVTGTATDNVGVSQVLFKLFRNEGGVYKYWNGTSFGTDAVLFPATVTSLGSANTSWNYTVPSNLQTALSSGTYYLTAYSKDAAGNQSSGSGRTFILTNSGATLRKAATSPSGNHS